MVVSGNTLNDNDLGIAAIQNGDQLAIQNNTVNFTTTPGVSQIEGIAVQDTNGLSTITNNIMNNLQDINMEIISSTDQSFQLSNNQFIGSQTGMLVTGNTTSGPIITMNGDSFTGTVGYYIQEVSAPNDIWPSTATVSFDGLLSGHITMTEFNQILTKIYDQHNDPALGLVLDYITPASPTLTSISPPSGPTAGGNTITITGTSFISSNTMVFFGGIPGTNVTVISDTTITVTAPAGIGTVDVTVVTPFGVTPIVPEDQHTYILSVPFPPSQFVGIAKKNSFLNRSEYSLKATWIASPSPDVVLYRIYYKGHIVDEILAVSPLAFTACVDKKKNVKKYQISAVNAEGLESSLVPIQVIYE